MRPTFPQLRRLDRDGLRARLDELGVELPITEVDAARAALAQPLTTSGMRLANRFAVLPMEGWDATPDGRPTELLRRRWARFGSSGAGLIWGGEAVAVAPSGRANPNQLCIGADSERDLTELRRLLVAEHRRVLGHDGELDPVVGLQLTHSGRWARPEGPPAPRTAYRHPLLDVRVGADDASVLSDAELDDLVGHFVDAAVVAQRAGFDFVDVKHCHGYLLHELLTAHDRPGPYGGDLEGRSRFAQRTLEGIRRDAPGLSVGVRLSAFDVAPHRAGPDGVGEPEARDGYRYAFGGDGTGEGVDLTEPHRFLSRVVELGVSLLCVTAGSPYWCPHVQRPAFFPPSDGYLPPRDPLVEVARLQAVTRELTAAHPELVVVGSGLTYLQEHLAAVAGGLVADGWMHVAGIGRMALSLPELPVRTLAGDPLERRAICRTFSDCTTAPRNGLVSGCYPLDPHYKSMPERRELAAIKRRAGVRDEPEDDA
jgi:2,4-dienoyl-CoA reductase-like NADH-dependent reductase (Old Yellow Enzyme family)